MKNDELIDIACDMANEVDRRIRKGEIEYSWMEEFFLEKLKKVNDAAAQPPSQSIS